MKLLDLFESRAVLLEVKARIEHPEDLIWETGAKGALQALQILELSARKPEQVSIKWDGSPALVAGWRDGEFMLTDKAGFSAKGYDGLTTSQHDLENMILNRKIKLDTPEAKASRRSYAHKIASLYPLLKQVIPASMQGYVQGDLLWTTTPPEQDGFYVFQPNKIRYRVPVDTDLGKQIGASQVGIVFHSKLDSPQDQEPDALRDPTQLGIRSTTQVVVVPHEMQFAEPFALDPVIKKKTSALIKSQAAAINEFLSPVQLSDRQLKGLPMVMKSFLAHKAGEGDTNLSNAPAEFATYITTDKSKVSPKARENMLKYIQEHVGGYNAVWQVVQLLVDLKLDLKAQMDATVGDKVQADLKHVPGHEGFVSVTDQGIIKLVNRAQFMKKDDPLTESDAHSPTKVTWTFGRMNPPTLGHKKVVDKVAELAGDNDYWIFLSHSQDAKKNPLDWKTKIYFASLMMPEYKSHFAAAPEFETVRTPLMAMDWLYDQGYTDITMVVGSDRVQSMTDMLNGWNSEQIRNKYNRQPVKIQVVSAGERDPDAEGVEGISASLVRKLAQDGDLEKFKSAVGLQDNLAQALYTQVRKGMKLDQNKNTMQEAYNPDPGTIVYMQMSTDSAHKLNTWCQQHGVKCMDPEHLHMSVITSVDHAPELEKLDQVQTNVSGSPVAWTFLGASTLALQLDAPQVERMHDILTRSGAVHKWPNFIPHVSVNYKARTNMPLPAQVPDFDLHFDLIKAEDQDTSFAAKTG